MSRDPRRRAEARLRRLRGAASAGLVACSSALGEEPPSYHVVDELPAPARCDELRPGELAAALDARATLDSRQDPRILLISLSFPGYDAPEGARVSAAPEVRGGRPRPATLGPQVRLEVEVYPESSAVEIAAPLSCEGRSEIARWRFDLSAIRADAQPPHSILSLRIAELTPSPADAKGRR